MTTALATIAPSLPQLTDFVEVLPLANATDVETATAFLRQVKTLEKSLEEERKALVAPLKAESSAIDARYREPRRALERIESMLKTRIAEVHAEADRQRTAALQAASDAAQSGDVAEASAAVLAASAPPPETPGVSVRFTYEPMVTDEALVPREYLTVDAGKLRAFAKDNAGGGWTEPPAIPGIFWRRAPIVSARSL